jgi:hypothetical protein
MQVFLFSPPAHDYYVIDLWTVKHARKYIKNETELLVLVSSSILCFYQS